MFLINLILFVNILVLCTGINLDEQIQPTSHLAIIGWSQVIGTIHWGCGGSLISNKFVLTAGRCVSSKPPDIVRLGIDASLSIMEPRNKFHTVQEFKIARIFRHPNHKVEIYYHDIAVVQLNGTVEFNERVLPACLWNLFIEPFEGLYTVGYHASYFKKIVMLSSRVTEYETVGFGDCFNTYATGVGTLLKMPAGIIRGQLCAKPKNIGQICYTTPGTPLQTNLKLLDKNLKVPFVVGISSFLNYGCNTTYPNVFTRTSLYLPWIKNVTKEEFDSVQCAQEYESIRNQFRSESDLITSGMKSHQKGFPGSK